jgi:serine protease Do
MIMNANQNLATRSSWFSRVGSRLAIALAAAFLGSAAATYAVHSQTNAPAASGNLSAETSRHAAPAVPNFVGLVQTVKPAVVSVRVKSAIPAKVFSERGGTSPFEGTPFERFFRGLPDAGGPFGGNPPRRFSQGQGSGFFVSADGYIVTNNHVIANAQKVEVVTDDGTSLDAKVVGTDPKTDLALLKVEGRTDFPFVKFAEVQPKIGEWVVAMGNPFGLGGTVTAGIVSAQDRNIGAGPYDDFLQIDAAVNRGNSGGPTFNMAGRVIGVNTAIYSPSGGSVGIAFDIPATTAKWIVEKLKEDGYVERGWLGVRVQAVTRPIADSLGLQGAKGALIAQIETGSPAAKAGLKAGDVITAIDGAEIKDPRDLASKIAAVAPDTKISISYTRAGRAATAEATVVQMRGQTERRRAPEHALNSDRAGKLGLTVAPAPEIDGAGDDGLAVLRVDPAGKAAELGIAPGDIILKAGGRQVERIDDFNRAMQAAAADGRSSMLVLVRRGDRQRYVALPVSVG